MAVGAGGRGGNIAETRFHDALDRLRADLVRVEIWAGAMSSFARPVPEYDISQSPLERYRLPQQERRQPVVAD